VTREYDGIEMKRIYVDYMWLGKPEDVKQFEARLLARDREGLVPGATVIIESDGMDDRDATFVEFLDKHTGLFSFVPTAGANAADASSNRPRRP
jgi:hypothetical protein